MLSWRNRVKTQISSVSQNCIISTELEYCVVISKRFFHRRRQKIRRTRTIDSSLGREKPTQRRTKLQKRNHGTSRTRNQSAKRQVKPYKPNTLLVIFNKTLFILQIFVHRILPILLEFYRSRHYRFLLSRLNSYWPLREDFASRVGEKRRSYESTSMCDYYDGISYLLFLRENEQKKIYLCHLTTMNTRAFATTQRSTRYAEFIFTKCTFHYPLFDIFPLDDFFTHNNTVWIVESVLWKFPYARRNKRKCLTVVCFPLFRFLLVYIIILIHGIGTLMPWNMFITAKSVGIGCFINL